MDTMENKNQKTGLYRQEFEHDNCGIGAVVNMKGIKTHQTVYRCSKDRRESGTQSRQGR